MIEMMTIMMVMIMVIVAATTTMMMMIGYYKVKFTGSYTKLNIFTVFIPRIVVNILTADIFKILNYRFTCVHINIYIFNLRQSGDYAI